MNDDFFGHSGSKWPTIFTHDCVTRENHWRIVLWPETLFADKPYIFIYYYCDVIMGAAASQTTSLTIVYSTVYSDADQRKHQSSASLVFVQGIHRWLVNSPHKWPVTRKIFPFDDVIMIWNLMSFSSRPSTDKNIYPLLTVHKGKQNRHGKDKKNTWSDFECFLTPTTC